MTGTAFPTNPTMQGAASFLSTVGVGGFISGVNTAMIPQAYADLALNAIHGALVASGYTSGQTPEAKLAAILGGYTHLEDSGRAAVRPQIHSLLRETAVAVDGAIRKIAHNSGPIVEEDFPLDVRLRPSAADFQIEATPRPSAGEPLVEILEKVSDDFAVAVPEGPIGATNPVVEADTAFGYDLFGRVAEGAEHWTNVFISPYSVAMALQMAQNGARGETLDVMNEAMHAAGISLADQNGVSQALMAALSTADPDVTLSIANSIWVSSMLKLKDGYVDMIRGVFGGVAESLSLGSEGRINQWISEKTGGMIRDMVKDGSIDPLTAMKLISAIYFKGRWTSPFDPRDTEQKSFYVNNAGSVRRVTVPMMFNEGRYRYKETLGKYRMIELPYGKGEFSMIFVLPIGAVDTLAAFREEFLGLGQLTSDLNGIGNVRPVFGGLSMPKFSVDYGIALDSALKAMGMGVAFDEGGNADFRRMVKSPSRDDLYIASVDHRAVVDVDEVGTRAAAATDVTMSFRSAPRRNFEMRIDRPFFYVIQHNATGLPVFMGWMSDPTK